MTKVTDLLMRHASDLIEDFTPSSAQIMAKDRFRRAFDSKKFLIDEENIFLADLEVMSGSRHIKKWTDENILFIFWFMDRDFESGRFAVLADLALIEMEKILRSPLIEKVLTAKDKLKAGEMALTLADKFPAKHKVTTYLDRDVAGMNDDVVAQQIKEAKRKIASGKVD